MMDIHPPRSSLWTGRETVYHGPTTGHADRCRRTQRSKESLSNTLQVLGRSLRMVVSFSFSAFESIGRGMILVSRDILNKGKSKSESWSIVISDMKVGQMV